MNNNKKNILFLVPSLVGGGAEASLIKLLKAFNYDLFNVTLVVVSFNGVYTEEIPEKVNVIPLFNNNYWVRILAWVQKKLGVNFILKSRWKQKVKGNFDTGISFLDSNFTDLLFYNNNVNRRLTWVHSSYKSNSNFNKFYQNEAYRQKVIKTRYEKLDAIVFVSNDAKEEFVEVFGTHKEMIVLYNLFDTEDIQQKSQAFEVANNGVFTFTAIGSLIPVKGYDLLINTAKILKNEGHEFQIRIVGKGWQEEELKQMVKDAGLENNIFFLGFQKNPFTYLKATDVFMMTSVSEALPSVLCEAIILEKAILVTNTSGCREVIDFGKYGMMVNREVTALAKGMKKYMTEPELLDKYQELSKTRRVIFDKESVLASYYKIIEGK